MSTKWYYVLNNDRVGPVEENELLKQFTSGVLKADSYVWKKGFDNWKFLKSVPELEYFFKKDEKKIESTDEMLLPPKIEEKNDKNEKSAQHFDWNTLSEDARVFTIKVGVDRGGNESEYGPFSLKMLKKLFDENRINEKTFIFAPKMDNWIFLGDAPIYNKYFSNNPPSIEDVDRRKTVRRPFVARLFMHDNQTLFEGVCRDISIGGMQILISGAEIEIGEFLSMNVHPDNSDYHFVATGKVVRRLDGDQGLSFRFVNLNKDAESAIKKYVDQNEG